MVDRPPPGSTPDRTITEYSLPWPEHTHGNCAPWAAREVRYLHPITFIQQTLTEHLVCAELRTRADFICSWSALDTAVSGTPALVSLLKCAHHLKEMYESISQDEINKNTRGHPQLPVSIFLPIVLLIKKTKTKNSPFTFKFNEANCFRISFCPKSVKKRDFRPTWQNHRADPLQPSLGRHKNRGKKAAGAVQGDPGPVRKGTHVYRACTKATLLSNFRLGTSSEHFLKLNIDGGPDKIQPLVKVIG